MSPRGVKQRSRSSNSSLHFTPVGYVCEVKARRQYRWGCVVLKELEPLHLARLLHGAIRDGRWVNADLIQYRLSSRGIPLLFSRGKHLAEIGYAA